MQLGKDNLGALLRPQERKWHPIEHAGRIRDVTFGVYWLGVSEPGRLGTAVRYVGRSDTDLGQELRASLGRFADRRPTHFAYVALNSAVAAFHVECREWHERGGAAGHLWNELHPDRPSGSTVRCAMLGCGHGRVDLGARRRS